MSVDRGFLRRVTRLTPTRVTLGLSVLLAVIVLAAMALSLLGERQRALETARQKADDIAHEQALLIRDRLGHIDAVLAQLEIRWHAKRLLREDTELSLRDLLRIHRNLLPDATELLLVDDAGRVRAAANSLHEPVDLAGYCPALATLRPAVGQRAFLAYRPEPVGQCPAQPGLIYAQPLRAGGTSLWLFLRPEGFQHTLELDLPRFSDTAHFRIGDGAGNILLASSGWQAQADDAHRASATAAVGGTDLGVQVGYQPAAILAQQWWPRARFSAVLALGLLLSWSLATAYILRTVRDYQGELAASEHHYRTLANSGAALIWTAGTDKLCNYFNEPWLRFTGRTLAQELGDGWTAGVHPDDYARCLATYVSHFDARQPFGMDYRLRHADGSYRWIHDDGVPRHDAAGNFLGYIGYCYDIDAQKQAAAELQAAQAAALEAQREGRLAALNQMEDANAARQAAEVSARQLSELNASLEARVAARTAELSAANRELESFAYAVSHDLRAPLRAMSGFAQALQEDCGAQLSGTAQLYLEQIGIASRKMGELIDGLLTLSRSTRGELRQDQVDISALARRRLAALARDEPQRQVATEVEDGLCVVGDARMLEVVIDNLIDNAWKYTGGTAAPLIRVHAGTVEGVSGVCISDNGAGFDMAHAERLFKPFQRLHRQDEFPGIGIGLATVQRIVQRHGGTVVATAAPGRGASFCLTLPQGSPETST